MVNAIAGPGRDRPSKWVYCRCFRHYRTGKLVYPKRAKFFRFLRKR